MIPPDIIEIEPITNLVALQDTNCETTLKELKPIFGEEGWMTEWEERQNDKRPNQKLKDAGLYNACLAQEWQLAADWILKGSTNDYADHNGDTALMIAANYGKLNIIKLIITQFDKEIYRKNNRMESALQFAINRGNRTVAEWLVINGADHVLLQLILGTSDVSDDNVASGHGDTFLHDKMKDYFEMINQNRNLFTELKKGFEFIKEHGLAAQPQITYNLHEIIQICTNYFRLNVRQILKDIFFRTYFWDEPLCWRYKSNKRIHFVASYFKKHQISSDIELTLKGKKIEVTFIFAILIIKPFSSFYLEPRKKLLTTQTLKNF